MQYDEERQNKKDRPGLKDAGKSPYNMYDKKEEAGSGAADMKAEG
jgi:hypothetical protein